MKEGTAPSRTENATAQSERHLLSAFSHDALTPELRHDVSPHGPKNIWEGPDVLWTSRLDRTPDTRCRWGKEKGSSSEAKTWRMAGEVSWWPVVSESDCSRGETRNRRVLENKENKMPFLIAVMIRFSKMCYRNCTLTPTRAHTHTHTLAPHTNTCIHP